MGRGPGARPLHVAPVAPPRSSTVLARVTFWMPGPEPMRLPFRSAMVLAVLAAGTMTWSSTLVALLGLEQKILKVPGAAISPMAMLAEPVPLALPSARSDSMPSMICCAPAKRSGSTFRPASLK